MPCECMPVFMRRFSFSLGLVFMFQALPQAIPRALASHAGSEVSSACLMCYLGYNRAKNLLHNQRLNPFPTKLTNLKTKSAWGDSLALY